MKKNILILIVAFGLFSFTNTAKAQAVEEGNILINAYYGGPDVFGAILESTRTNSNSTNTKISVLGPLGATVSYMISKDVGLGLDINHTDVKLTFSDPAVDSAGNTIFYSYSFGRTILRIMPRFDYHFTDDENFDGYFGIAAGFRKATWYTESSDPNFVDDDTEGINPIALRVAVGGTYYLIDNLGLNLELGLFGGGLVRGGLVLKF